MRKVLSIAGAVMIASSIIAMPASAQTTGGGQQPNQGGGANNEAETSTGRPVGGQSPGGSTQSGQTSGQNQTQPGGGEPTGAPQGGQMGGGQMGGGQMGGGMMGGGMMGGGQNVQMGSMMNGMQASFSCGSQAGMYGMTNVDEEMFPGGGETVTGLFYRINYAGLPATTIGVLRYYNDEQTFQGVTPFPGRSGSGMIEGAVRANVDPAAQGAEGSPSPRAGRADGPVTSQRGAGGSGSSGYGGGGGLMPGEYIFDVYTGEMRQTAEGNMFVADPQGFLGRFTCGVQD